MTTAPVLAELLKPLTADELKSSALVVGRARDLCELGEFSEVGEASIFVREWSRAQRGEKVLPAMAEYVERYQSLLGQISEVEELRTEALAMQSELESLAEARAQAAQQLATVRGKIADLARYETERKAYYLQHVEGRPDIDVPTHVEWEKTLLAISANIQRSTKETVPHYEALLAAAEKALADFNAKIDATP